MSRYLFHAALGDAGEWYTITPDVKGKHWAVQRDGHESHNVVPTKGDPDCCCGDMVWRRKNLLATPCVHVRALRSFLSQGEHTNGV